MPLLLTYNRSNNLFWCFHCWLWTSEFESGEYFFYNPLLKHVSQLIIPLTPKLPKNYPKTTQKLPVPDNYCCKTPNCRCLRRSWLFIINMQHSLNIYCSCRKFKDLAEFLPNVLTGLKLEFLLFSEIFPRSDFNRSTIWKVGDFEKKHSYQGYVFVKKRTTSQAFPCKSCENFRISLSCAEAATRNGALRNFAKFTGKHLC